MGRTHYPLHDPRGVEQERAEIADERDRAIADLEMELAELKTKMAAQDAEMEQLRAIAEAAKAIEDDTARWADFKALRVAVAQWKGDVCDHGKAELEECEACEHDRASDGETDGARL